MKPVPNKYVKPLIPREEAQDLLTEEKWFHIKKRQLRRIELVYIPHYFFYLVIILKSGEKDVVASTEGVLGSFALADKQMLEYETETTGEKFQFTINRTEAEKICLNEYRKMLLGYGLRQKELVALKEIKAIEEVMYPFWVAYIKIGTQYDFKAIDAVSGKPQGIKMRKVFLSAFSQKEK